uniref:Glycoside hydrolase family 38 central domain-containing protein n=1 Tax=Plectus sambesii TaxID=2011161 RepID=A0A914WPV6_9BILA
MTNFLNVFLLLHSHVDPGWLQTFDEYYEKKVQSILTLAVRYLNQEPSLRFIWSEMSFLEKWWQNSTQKQKSDLLKVINSGQFEMTGGAWVMTDEATPYYWATIDNLIEGHQFLASQLKVYPTTSWSVDPFGHGAMMPYLLNLAGIKKMAIGRINNAHKTLMRDRQQLVFRWRQTWDKTGVFDNWVHTLPRTYYTTWNTCGPEREVCCKFAFGPSAMTECGLTEQITANISELAEQLVKNYRITAASYSSNALLVSVGGDFYMSEESDWTENIKQYGALMKHINSDPKKYAMKIQFGTLSDYFAAIGKPSSFPTLSGDFFPYMDDPNPSSFSWWTGYFTTRPYHKRLERIIQSQLRATDLLSAFAFNSGNWSHKSIKPRRDLALFQHHDAITGTSKAYVMDDYLKRLLNSSQSMRVQANTLVDFLLHGKKTVANNEKTYFFSETQNEAGSNENELPVPLVIPLHQKATIVVYNQLARRHVQVVRITIQAPTIKVVRISDQTIITAQINPIIRSEDIVSDMYEIVFLVNSEPLSLTTYELQNVGHQPETTEMATIISDMLSTRLKKFHGFSCKLSGSKQITLANEYLSVNVDPLGYLQNVTIIGQDNGVALKMSYWSYTDSGGAYVFKPREVKKINDGMPAILISGSIVSEVTARFSGQLSQVISLFSSAGTLGRGIHITLRPNMESAIKILPFISFSTALPCDIEMINIRPLVDGSLLLLLRRIPVDCSIETSDVTQCDYNPNSLQGIIDALGVNTIKETTLTGTKSIRTVSVSDILSQLNAIDIRAYRLLK